jgi:phosphoribosylformylglycinamidine cyclo-ligase
MKTVEVKGLAHITGGGLVGNVPRVLQENLAARIDRGAWPFPPVFQWLQNQGNVPDDEMFRVFNCGIGMVMVVSAGEADAAAAALRQSGEQVYRIGVIEVRTAGEPQTIVA